MKEDNELLAGVLRDVSRSFYLSLRILPKGMRRPAGVGYLLARLSDTIADAGAVDEEKRGELLDEFRECVCEGADLDAGGLHQLKKDPGLSEGERVLIGRADDCLKALGTLPEPERDAVKKVVGIITEGQKWDLTRFRGEGVVRLRDPEELEKYTYQVAGCVGEFWTTIAALDDPDFSKEETEQMMTWGREYGRALQLVNILRDVPEDLERGRCYLPGGGCQTEELLEVRSQWIAEARKGLASASRYVSAVKKRRLRVASALPYLIGEKTLKLLEMTSWEDWQAGVKIPRREVWKSLLVSGIS